MQRNWIGRSHGARVTFPIALRRQPDAVARPAATPASRSSRPAPTPSSARPSWCWRPSTRSSTSWCRPAAGPRAPRTPGPVAPRRRRRPSTAYRRAASRKNDVERQSEGKDKTGVFTGGWATNPVTGTRIPVFVADYVLMGYGTGAIMAVPGQDERDWDFAKAFDLPIIRTVQPDRGPRPETPRSPAQGPAINSQQRRAEPRRARRRRGQGADHRLARRSRASASRTVTYKLRDWLFSRQRYWGEPFPVVFDEDGVAHGVPDVDAAGRAARGARLQPEDLRPRRREQRARAAAVAGRRVGATSTLDLGDGRGTRRYRRETNTMPNWAGSCWYYLRYLDPANRAALVDPDNEAYWMGPRAEPVAGAPAGTRDPGGVDLYVGGVEHAVLHLLYARFWHKVLHDLGHLEQRRAVPHLLQPGLHPGRRLHATPAASTSRPRRSRRPPTASLHLAGPSRSPASSARSASR